MEANKIVLGYDLSEEYAQISYYISTREKPETFACYSEGEKYNIPLYLCKRTDANQWYHGREAIAFSKEGEGLLVGDLLNKAIQGKQVLLGETVFEAVQLLGLFVKKSFGHMGFFLGGYEIEALMFTVNNLDKRLVSVLEEVAAGLNLAKERIFFQSYSESIFHYVMNQPMELRSGPVGIFDFTSDTLKSYRFELNHNTTPEVALIHEKLHENVVKRTEFSSGADREEYYNQLDGDFLHLMTHYLSEHNLTSIYLMGDGFDGEWYKASLNYLCKGRRVFGGNNLYSKGASLAAKEKKYPGFLTEKYVFLGKDKLKANVGMKIFNGSEELYQPLLDAGTNWYEANTEVSVMLWDEESVTFIVTPVDGSEARQFEIKVDGYENRPLGTVRLQIILRMQSDRMLHVRISDDGFGDFFPQRDDVWEELRCLIED